MGLIVDNVGGTGLVSQRRRVIDVQSQKHRLPHHQQSHQDESFLRGRSEQITTTPDGRSGLQRRITLLGDEAVSGAAVRGHLGVETQPCVLRSSSFLQDSPTSMSNRRGIDLSIPQFDRLSNKGPPRATTIIDAKPCGKNASEDPVNGNSLTELSCIQGARQQLLRSQSLGPLTPPHDIDVLSWAEDAIVQMPTDAEMKTEDRTATKQDTSQPGQDLNLSQGLLAEMASGFQLPSQGISQLPWLERALRIINRFSEGNKFSQYIEVASQVLPNHASDRRVVKTSEMICDHLQQTLADLQGITITHAITVPQSQVVEDFPKSPPTTPNFVVTNGYFDEPIIVTKAANVPLYHGLSGTSQDPAAQMQRRIMVRSVVDLAVLERCIPPTTAGEIVDFFNADSYRSYLADRLSELTIGTGSLLLIYPTRSGGRTFARKCIAPVLDPLLREMSILRGLDTDAAQRLGTMESVDSMIEFDEMKGKVEVLCNNMSEKSRAPSIRSSYKIVHSEAGQVILDRNTWMTWFVEQEQQRLKQNLVDYHKDGGRLPHGDGGSSELTAGMLTREIIEGLQKSKKGAGNASIEVGVFVIQRTRKST